jgi:hypothetical protein
MTDHLVKLSDVIKFMREDAQIMREAFAGQKDWELCADYIDDTARIYEEDINWEEM